MQDQIEFRYLGCQKRYTSSKKKLFLLPSSYLAWLQHTFPSLQKLHKRVIEGVQSYWTFIRCLRCWCARRLELFFLWRRFLYEKTVCRREVSWMGCGLISTKLQIARKYFPSWQHEQKWSCKRNQLAFPRNCSLTLQTCFRTFSSTCTFFSSSTNCLWITSDWYSFSESHLNTHDSSGVMMLCKKYGLI